ncbi:hypothetical protein KKE06_00275 [Candidatus Micrarchaeota archaeon]|nr:hypothetical protein [Candidatus Micrarchaeota archaeon]MBU1930927.1 hypothetical protein [Candidatus Micrarchaeota archaeon]
MAEAELFKLLVEFGLTEYEAKTLSTLFKLQEAEAPEVSRLAQVPKTRVYDVLDKLIEKKLVIEVNGRPKKYMVVDLENALDQLVQSKKQELTGLEERTHTIKFQLQGFSGIEESDSEKVMKVKDKNDFIKILAQEIEKAKKEVLAFTKLDHNNSLFKQKLKNAAKKNVTVRLISHGLPESCAVAKELQQNGVKTRNFKHGMTAFVIDNKKVILSLSDLEKVKPEYHFTIWPNNPHLANAFQHYFDKCWQQTK